MSSSASSLCGNRINPANFHSSGAEEFSYIVRTPEDHLGVWSYYWMLYRLLKDSAVAFADSPSGKKEGSESSPRLVEKDRSVRSSLRRVVYREGG